ncbi:glycosyltransferase family 1 protein [Solihabitans fulvus]|uniref:Glycosyltransferase family 1 protein n=1 Tax=Solihabitans fulvus TaxID=1892852 RepID=A0A5B2WYC6_9PSEU|nr:glycosyltransferase [Solihabitans fulvus]KAA2255920.1 glycosyltransferase family 1 protein [Solihabitans fulvus]
MSRFLFVVPPLVGHVNPALGIAQALARNGHEVAWTGSELSLRPLLGADATVFPTGTRLHRPQADCGLAALKSLWTRFVVPFARFTLPAVDKAVVAYEPDVVVVDQHTPTGAAVAHRHGLPWATLACSTIELARPYRGLPKVEAWMRDLLLTLWTDAGLPEADWHDQRFSPHLVLACAIRELLGDNTFPDHVKLIGPPLADRPGRDFDLGLLDLNRRRVLVSTGTLADDVADGFHARVLRALEPLADRVQAILVAPPEAVPAPPPNVLVVPSVPMLRLLPHLDAVVSHGGLGTVNEALAHGVPLVVAPIRHDQPINAARVASAGAGVRVSFARVGPDALRDAISTVLDDPSYRAAAARLRDSITAAGGATVAARHLERLARNGSDRVSAAVRQRGNG